MAPDFANAPIWRARVFWAGITIAIIIAGLAVRYGLPLPGTIRKYGGSMLWAAMVASGLCMLAPRAKPINIALGAGLIAAAVEFSRLVPFAPLDRFRETLAGQLTLGRIFSLWNLLAYAAGIALMFVAMARRPR